MANLPRTREDRSTDETLGEVYGPEANYMRLPDGHALWRTFVLTYSSYSSEEKPVGTHTL